MSLNEQQIADDEGETVGDAYDRLMEGVELDTDDEFDEGLDDAPEAEELDRDEKGRFKAKAGDKDEGDDEPEAEEETAETPDEPADEPPSYIPRVIADHWKDLPKDVRETFAASQQEMMTRLTNAGRTEKALQPILAEVQRASKSFPELANMTPDQIAKDVFEMAHTRANLMRDPLGTLLKVAQQTNIMPQLAARFGAQGSGQLQAIQMQQEIAALKQQLQNAPPPANIETIVEQQLAQRETNQVIDIFAAGKEHWQTVEPDMPVFIQAVMQTQTGQRSPQDTLQAAYDMALSARGLKAQAAVPEKAPKALDPQRTEAAIRAKSVNVKSTTARAKPMSEREAMAAAYDRLMKK